MTSWNVRLAATLGIGFAAACSGAPAGGADADAGLGDDGFGFDITPPEPPNIPWLDAGQPPIEAPRRA